MTRELAVAQVEDLCELAIDHVQEGLVVATDRRRRRLVLALPGTVVAESILDQPVDRAQFETTNYPSTRRPKAGS